MNKIIDAINEYSLRVFKGNIGVVTHTYGDYYMANIGLTTIYFTVVNNVVVDAMVD